MAYGFKASRRFGVALLGAIALLGLAATPAQAVIVEQGEVETDGVSNTIDLFFFQVLVGGAMTINVSPIPGDDVLTGNENPQLLVYLDDGTLGAANFLVGDDDTNGLNPEITFNFAAGSYVAVVGASDVGIGQFGPFQTDALSTSGFIYEIGFSGPASNDTNLNCILEGNLDGTRDKTVRQADTCHTNVVSVDEPAAAGLLGFGLVTLALAAARRPSYSSRRR